MKVCRLFITVVLVSLLLSACTSGEERSNVSVLTETSQSEVSPVSAVQDKVTSDTASNGEIDISQHSDWTGYIGYSDNGKNYHHLYGKGDDEARNRRWEEIIVQFADSYLSPGSGHPYLSDREVIYQILDEDYRVSDQSRYVNVFDENKQKIFIGSINALIPGICDMTDTEIMFSLAKVIFAIGESHTATSIPSINSYPLTFRLLHRNGQPHIYCSAAPKEQSDLIGCELVSVNQVPISEVVELLSPYLHAYDEHSMVSDLVYNSGLNSWEALQMVGIIGEGDTTVEFELKSADEKITKVSFEKISHNDFVKWFRSNDKASIYDKYPKPYYRSRSEKLWYEMLDDDTLYLRISTFLLDMGGFPYKVRDFVKEKGCVSTLILDLRDNGGGYAEPSMYKSIRDMDLEEIFILTNSCTQSASLGLAQAIRRYCANVTVIGSYGWHTNFLASPKIKLITNVPGFEKFEYSLPESAVQNSENTDWISGSTELFTPDVLLYFEYEDFIEGRDTFLEWIKNR